MLSWKCKFDRLEKLREKLLEYTKLMKNRRKLHIKKRYKNIIKTFDTFSRDAIIDADGLLLGCDATVSTDKFELFGSLEGGGTSRSCWTIRCT